MLRLKQSASPRERASEVEEGGEDDDDFDDEETLARQLQFVEAKRKRFEFLSELLVADRLGTA
jgi:hypothetical protein